jgi:iron(III) transport system permease protein
VSEAGPPRLDATAMARRGPTLSGALLTLLLTWLVLYPIIIVVVDGARGDGLRAFLTRPDDWRALWASLWISVASVGLAAAIGVPLAFLFEWLEFPGRKLLGSLIALPAVLPPFVGVIAFLFLYGESGFVARFLQFVFRFRQAPWHLQGAGAILLVHAYSMYVYFYLFARAGLARLDAAMLEAAQALGAGHWRTFVRVILPVLRPSLAGAALLTFMTSLGSFSAPYVFGGGFRVMTTQIFASKQNGELGVAMAETVALAGVALAGLVLLRRTEGEGILVGIGKGTAPRRRALRRPTVRVATTGLGWGLAVLLLLPHLTLVLVSLVPYATWTTQTVPPVLNLVNYQRLFSEPDRLAPLVNSLWMAAASTGVAVAVALAAGWLVVRRRVAVRSAIETLLALPWALPGTVFAIALATAFSTSNPWQLRWVLVGTVAILPLAYLVRNLPITGRAILAGYRQLDPALEEAAASLGAGAWATLRRVTLPQLRPALTAGGSLAFVGALGDFVTSIILYTYQNRPISMEINSALRVNEMGVAAAFGVILMVVSAIVLGIGARR